MPRKGSQFSNELESGLHKGLVALRAVAYDMGAHSVSVFVVKDGRTIRNLSMWPESDRQGSEMQLERSLGESLRHSPGYASENSPLARFLEREFPAGGSSFLLFPWGTERLTVVVAFGFAASPAGLAGNETPPAVSLAEVAAWSVYEVFRLHSELVIVNERLGTRKLIERAKGLLQVERGLDEQQAYAHLRKLSRQRRMRLSEVATDLLGRSQLP